MPSAKSYYQPLAQVLEAKGARISNPDDRTFDTEGEAIESGLRRTVDGWDIVMRSLIRAVYRFRDAALIAEKKEDFGSALQNLYRELERAENLVGPSQSSRKKPRGAFEAFGAAVGDGSRFLGVWLFPVGGAYLPFIEFSNVDRNAVALLSERVI
jgi:hypothetical protein